MIRFGKTLPEDIKLAIKDREILLASKQRFKGGLKH